MPLVAVALALVVVLALVGMIPLSIVLRYRAGTARRTGRGWVAAINTAGLVLSAGFFLGVAGVTNLWVPNALRYALVGLGVGAVLGFIGLWTSRWEATPQALHYTPNRGLVLAITLTVVARMAYGFWRGWHAWRSTPDDTTWLAAAGAAGSLGVGAVVLGYYLVYSAGVWSRVRRYRRGPWLAP